MKRKFVAIAGCALVALASVVALRPRTPATASPLGRTDAPIVFVCQNGVAMSVWSALRFNQLAAERGLSVRAQARAAARTFTNVPTRMKVALALDGYAIGGYLPQVINAKHVRHADRVVVIDTELPPPASGGGAALERWGGFPPMRERYFASRAALEVRVEELVARLAASRDGHRPSQPGLAAAFQPTASGIAVLMLAMLAVALLELLVPLHARAYWNRAHLRPNLALTFLNFGTNVVLNAGLLLLVMWLESKGFGLVRWLSLPSLVASIIVVTALDFSFYAAHVCSHKVPWLWRLHAVHHSDPALDVTTTFRHHPVHGVFLYAVTALTVIVLGPSPAAFAVYRVASLLNALLEHANIRAPRWLDAALSLVTSWPHMHKVHHSRNAAQTDSNYGNLFSFWDRLFGTFTPTEQGTDISSGLDGGDHPAAQTTHALLRAPFRNANRRQIPGVIEEAS